VHIPAKTPIKPPSASFCSPPSPTSIASRHSRRRRCAASAGLARRPTPHKVPSPSRALPPFVRSKLQFFPSTDLVRVLINSLSPPCYRTLHDSPGNSARPLIRGGRRGDVGLRGAPLRVEGRRRRVQDLPAAGWHRPQERLPRHQEPPLQGISYGPAVSFGLDLDLVAAVTVMSDLG
jgi:hypothetical protein